MLKCEINERSCKVEVLGDAVTVAAEVGVLIGSVYSYLLTVDKSYAEVFRILCRANTNEDSPVWDMKPGESVGFVVPRKREEGAYD